ncbi:MAG: oligosaccharide flippase family protein, partial [Lachnospiraceae bacterium]|nr:oligosaccharide flippase family protein [Lachnospiraceae bacterium]
MKSTLIKGTLILTIAGFACRILGFFYRIYLSKGLGAEGLGIYQMIFPVYSICFTIYASGIQTGVSQLLSERTTSQIPKRLIKTGL